MERRGRRHKVYALEVYVDADEYQESPVALVDVSGTEVALPVDDLRSVIEAARGRPTARQPAAQSRAKRTERS